MTDYILANGGCVPSAKLLRDSIAELHPKVTVKNLLVTRRETNRTILFRYGNSNYLPNSIYPEKINPPDFIKLSSDKKEFSKFCMDRDILVPEFTLLKDKWPSTLPVLVRTTLTGKGSEGIIPIHSIEELTNINQRYYWTPYVNVSTEYRVHMINDKIIRVFIKQFEGTSENGVIIRNNGNSHFSLVLDFDDKLAQGKYVKLKEVSKNIYAALYEQFNLPLMFSLDIGFATNEKSYIVFEINSASGLVKNTADAYAKELISILY